MVGCSDRFLGQLFEVVGVALVAPAVRLLIVKVTESPHFPRGVNDRLLANVATCGDLGATWEKLSRLGVVEIENHRHRCPSLGVAKAIIGANGVHYVQLLLDCPTLPWKLRFDSLPHHHTSSALRAVASSQV